MQFNPIIQSLMVMMMAIFASAEPRLLENQTFHCCTIQEYPVVSEDKLSHPYAFKGLAFDYLLSLESRLGFRCISMYEYKGPDTSFTQFTEHMHNCSIAPNPADPVCKCQLGVAGWTKTRERIGRVLYLPSFVRLDTVVLTHIDYTASSASGGFFVSAFTPLVWVLIGVLFALFTIVRMMDLRFEQPLLDYQPLPETESRFKRMKHFLLKSALLCRLRKAGFRTAMEMTQQVDQTAGMQRNSTRQWVLTFGIMLAGLFFVLTYEATMTAFLVQEKISAPYRTSDDFYKCRIDVKDICMPKGGAVESFWRNSFAKEKCYNGQMPRFIESYDSVTDTVASKKCKFVISGNAQSGDAMSGKHCSKVMKVGDAVWFGGLSWIMPINANKTVFNILRNTTLDLVEQGKLMTLDQYFKQRGECFRQADGALSFPRLRIFFFVSFSFIFVMFMIMLLDPQGASRNEQNGDCDEADDEMKMGMEAASPGSSSEPSWDENERSGTH